jgi:hypothetical protein
MFSCDSNAEEIKSNDDAIRLVKNYIENNKQYLYEYRAIIRSSDYVSIGAVRRKDDLGWNVSRIVGAFPVYKESIEIDFNGRDGTFASCRILQCGKILGCETY